MPHSRYVDDDGLLITRLSGVVTMKELIALQNEMHNYVDNEYIQLCFFSTEDTARKWLKEMKC